MALLTAQQADPNNRHDGTGDWGSRTERRARPRISAVPPGRPTCAGYRSVSTRPKRPRAANWLAKTKLLGYSRVLHGLPASFATLGSLALPRARKFEGPANLSRPYHQLLLRVFGRLMIKAEHSAETRRIYPIRQ